MTDFSCDYSSARPAGHPLADLSNKLIARVQARRARRQLRALTELDDLALRDIGLTHHDVTRALNSPLSTDAQAELYRIAHLNSTARM